MRLIKAGQVLAVEGVVDDERMRARGGRLGRTGQHPDDYVCNCGPWSAPATV